MQVQSVRCHGEGRGTDPRVVISPQAPQALSAAGGFCELGELEPG